MTTSAPVRKVHDIPIIEPVRSPKVLPKEPSRLPEADPKRWITPDVGVPERVRHPARVVPDKREMEV